MSGLPPKPDLQTGEPRPPHAPLEPDWKMPEAKHKHGEGKVPQPPEGEGNMLEWFYPTKGYSFSIGFIIAGIVFVSLTLRDWGFWWTTVWWLWLFIVPWPFVFFWAGRNIRISAGADWLCYGKTFVKTYDLVSIKVTVGGAARYIELKDGHGNSMDVQINKLQMNRELWDLVYNGIVHSVRKNNAESNKMARDYLGMNNPMHYR